jgi:hypothetical protein
VTILLLVRESRNLSPTPAALLLDRENGSAIYAKRLADICKARELSAAERLDLRKRLTYLDYPSIKRGDGDALADAFGRSDLVVFDAQRMFLTDLGLKEHFSRRIGASPTGSSAPS